LYFKDILHYDIYTYANREKHDSHTHTHTYTHTHSLSLLFSLSSTHTHSRTRTHDNSLAAGASVEACMCIHICMCIHVYVDINDLNDIFKRYISIRHMQIKYVIITCMNIHVGSNLAAFAAVAGNEAGVYAYYVY